MQKAGGIIGLVAGIFGVLAAIVTLIVGGAGSAFQADQAHLVVGLGFGGVFFSFLVIVFGAVAMGAKSKVPGALLTVSSIAGAIFGGTFVAVFMLLAFIGGILAVIGTKKDSLAAKEAVSP